MVLQKQKAPDAVKFPCDGPLFAFLQLGSSNGLISNVISPGSGLQEARDLMLLSNNDDVVVNENDKGTINTYTNQLISELQHANTLRDQLSSLRQFKSNTVNITKHPGTQCLDNDDEFRTIRGVYRMILELCLSSQTPQSFKKAGNSCLSVLIEYSNNTLIQRIFDDIHSSVLMSIFWSIDNHETSESIPSQYWENPVQTLFDALSYEPTHSCLMRHHENIVLVFKLMLFEGSKFKETITFYEHGNNRIANEVIGANVLGAIDSLFEICSTLKVILTSLVAKQSKKKFEHEEKLLLLDLSVSIIDIILKPLLCCRAATVDSLSVCGVCYGQILLFKWRLENDDDKGVAVNVSSFLKILLGEDDDSLTKDSDQTEGLNIKANNLSTVMIVKGLASILSDSILQHSISWKMKEMLLIQPIASYMKALSLESSNDAIRLWTLKGMETVLGRCKAIVVSNTISPSMVSYVTDLANDVLKLSLITFDSPPCRQVASAVPGLFKSLVNLLEALDKCINDDNVNNEKMNILVSRVLSQPASRKGKYIALDSLLYKIGATKLLHLSELQGDESLVMSFVNEVGDRGNSAGAVAELLGKILSLLREEMHKEKGIDLVRENESKKQRRKKERKIRELGIVDASVNESINLLPQWMDIWVPSFATAILNGRESRRSHISSYCLPLIVAMVGGADRKLDACHCFAALITEINRRDESFDRAVWAKLEVMRHAGLQKLIRQSLNSQVLKEAIQQSISVDILKVALIHESSRVRLVAFQTIHLILPSLNDKLFYNPIECIKLEVKLWKQSLPYAFDCPEKEHMVVMNTTLNNFLRRITDVDATNQEREETYIVSYFVNEILLEGLFMKQAYPGTISEKESFALRMLDTIILFSSRKVTSKNQTFDKKCQSSIISALISENIFATLLSLLSSMWDATRESAFACVCKLIALVQGTEFTLPSFFKCGYSYNQLRSRATHLASSPRQREADTGAKLLAILYYVLSSDVDKKNYLQDLVSFTSERLELMAHALGVVLNQESGNSPEIEGIHIESDQLPLPHGLIQALRLIVDGTLVDHRDDNQGIFVDLINICCHAIEISLVVVADINEDFDGDQDFQDHNVSSSVNNRWKAARAKKTAGTPLNVNTGALGANATFASTRSVDEDEHCERLSTQRILVGSWLLTKEACATLSSVIALFPGEIHHRLLSAAGGLLLSTLTTLKHQGAAFAAHKSLHQICNRCYSEGDRDGIRLLPSQWASRLIHEISSPEVVRDSTLRRSTGYGLGALSVLRTERSGGQNFLFRSVLSIIIRLSLPSDSVMKNYVSRWGFLSEKEMFTYVDHLSADTETNFVDDTDYEWRTRIHALNILRLVILDAPLSAEMKPFIGDSLISALIGYSDTSWAVRNSATMTFSAVMLRVVDADKNAGGKIKGIRHEVGVSAITATELFRSYPPLAISLLALMKEETGEVEINRLHPALFPLLLLLSRLQPISMSRIDPRADDISGMFIAPVIHCLGHPHHKVRLVASRALAVLCSGDDENSILKKTSRKALVEQCISLLSESLCRSQKSNNQDHGLLLALYQLLRDCSTPAMYFSTSMKEIFSYYGSWGFFKGTCPPSCAAMALRIWQLQSRDHLENEESYVMTFLNTASKVIKCVEISSKLERSIVGLSALGADAATLVVDTVVPMIFFKDSDSISNQLYFIDVVESLICSDSFDVMLHSVKAFKKKLDESVKILLGFKIASLLLQTIGRMLLSSMVLILKRDGDSCHPPTMRRLSRCVIEVAEGYRCVSDNASGLIDFSSASVEQIFQSIVNMMLLEKGSIGCVGRNALELMGLIIPDMLHHEQDNNYGQCVEHNLSLFMETIAKATNPDKTSWRVRYSAAICTKWTGLLSNTLNNDNSQFVQSIIMQHRIDLNFQMIQLLQDSDEDVRKMAAKALLNSGIQTASLRNLEYGYDQFSCQDSEERLILMLVNQIVFECQDVNLIIEETLKEFEYSIETTDLKSLQNLGKERKIFEDEERNKESLLILHLSVLTLTKLSRLSKHRHNESNELCERLFCICTTMLKQMVSITTRIIKEHKDISHNLSWTSKVFPGIHGILLGTTFCVYHFGIIVDDMNGDITNLLTHHHSMHPFIVQALRDLSLARCGDVSTYERLLNSCFLVPSSQEEAK